MTDNEEREAISAAMHRLLGGRPLRSSGNLDIVTLAAEAGLKRNKLTHKHKDLKDLFYAELRARDSVPDSELKLRDEIAVLKETISNLREERDSYRIAADTFARAIDVLTIENDNLRKQVSKDRESTVTTLRPRR